MRNGLVGMQLKLERLKNWSGRESISGGGRCPFVDSQEWMEKLGLNGKCGKGRVYRELVIEGSIKFLRKLKLLSVTVKRGEGVTS